MKKKKTGHQERLDLCCNHNTMQSIVDILGALLNIVVNVGVLPGEPGKEMIASIYKMEMDPIVGSALANLE